MGIVVFLGVHKCDKPFLCFYVTSYLVKQYASIFQRIRIPVLCLDTFSPDGYCILFLCVDTEFPFIYENLILITSCVQQSFVNNV